MKMWWNGMNEVCEWDEMHGWNEMWWMKMIMLEMKRHEGRGLNIWDLKVTNETWDPNKKRWNEEFIKND